MDKPDETVVAPEAVPPEFPKVGERLGSYELLKPLEAGGMGVVYLGRRADDAYEQQVAIKLVRPVHLMAPPATRQELVRRFEHERAILARMNHPNVARILDGGSTASGIPYLVMEFVDGVPLTDYCRQQGLDVPARLALFAKVCDGVQEAHRHLVVHRDLKPDNILVGANGEPRLLDFGIAKILGDAPGAVGQDGTSLTAMTPAYASPEQVRQQPLTTSSDVYSLGVMLYQLLAGVRPYELGGLRPSEVESVVCDLNAEPLRRMLDRAAIGDAERKRRRAQLVPDVERIVAKAMHKDPARRYGSAQELADDIRRYLAGEPVLATPDSFGYRARKFLGRHRVAASVAALALAGIVGAGGVAAWQAQRATRAAADTERVNTFLLEVLRSSDPFDAGRELSLGEAVDLASSRVPGRFAGRPDLSSRIHHALGYGMLGRQQLDLAERELGLALAEAREAFGEDAIQTLRVQEAIAQLRMAQGRSEAAASAWTALLSRLESLGRQDDPLYLIAGNNLGNLYLSLEDYGRAEAQFERVRALPPPSADAGFSPVDAATLVGNLAYAAHGQGDVERADALYREAIAALERLEPEGRLELASALNNHGHLRLEQDDLEGALALFERSVALRERAFPDGHPMVVGALAGLAMNTMRAGRPDEALAQAARASEMAGRVFPGPHRDQAFAHWVLSATRMRAGDFAGAADALAKAQAAFDALSPPPADLAESLPALRERVCADPAAAVRPGCAAPP